MHDAGYWFLDAGTQISGIRCQPSRRPKKQPVKSKKKLIVHRRVRRERRERKFKTISAISACSAVRYFLKMASDFIKFHISAASSQKNGQSVQERNFEKANIE
jgi:hypothetical protein